MTSKISIAQKPVGSENRTAPESQVSTKGSHFDNYFLSFILSFNLAGVFKLLSFQF